MRWDARAYDSRVLTRLHVTDRELQKKVLDGSSLILPFLLDSIRFRSQFQCDGSYTVRTLIFHSDITASPFPLLFLSFPK